MKVNFRNITCIFFMLLGFIPVILIIIFSLQQQAIRSQMKEKLERGQLHTILLADHEVRWVKAGKEIWVEGKMFDIKSYESKNGFSIFKGLFDHEETLLKLALKKNWEKKQQDQDQLLLQLFQSLQSIYFSWYHTPFAGDGNSRLMDCFFSPAIPAPYLEIPDPPPLA